VTSLSEKILGFVLGVSDSKTAKRALLFTIILGIYGLVFTGVGLNPAFKSTNATVKGLEIQIQSEIDASHGLTNAFIQQCMNRKRSQVLSTLKESIPARFIH
jgi:hypothetical protein